jgi:hypothetical protein
MAEFDVGTGTPRTACLIRTRQPYLLFDVKASEGWVVNLRYLSLNKGTDSSGENAVSSFTSRTEIPDLDERYHRLIMLCAGKMIAGELAPLTNPDGSERYPGMSKALQYFNSEYEAQMAKDKEEASNRSIGRVMQSFDFGGAGQWYPY